MRLSLIGTILAIGGNISNAFAAPAAGPAVNALEARYTVPQLDASTALTMVNQLYSALLPHMRSINQTAVGLGKSPTAAQRAAAIKSAGANIQAMTTEINTAVAHIGLAATGGSFTSGGTKMARDDAALGKSFTVEERQDPLQALAEALALLLINLAGTINTLIAVLGLTGLLSFLNPLLGSLSGLVLELITVVNPLLAVLEVLLDNVLIGLSGLLAGLIL